MHKNVLAVLACATVLTGCSLSDPTSAFTATESAYFAALAGENLYLSSGKADPALTAKIEAARVKAHAVLAPIEAEIIAGTVPTNDEMLIAQAAVGALTALVPQPTGAK